MLHITTCRLYNVQRCFSPLLAICFWPLITLLPTFLSNIILIYPLLIPSNYLVITLVINFIIISLLSEYDPTLTLLLPSSSVPFPVFLRSICMSSLCCTVDSCLYITSLIHCWLCWPLRTDGSVASTVLIITVCELARGKPSRHPAN